MTSVGGTGIAEREYPPVTLAILAYNQEKFIADAVEGAFSQTYSPLEIILSDDASTDGTFDVMAQMAAEYRGPHKIRLNRNQPNLGLIAHFNKVSFELCQTEILIGAAGDDRSFPDRVSKTWAVFDSNPNVYSVCMNYQRMTYDGVLIDEPISTRKNRTLTLDDYINGAIVPSMGCTRAYKREIFSVFGPLVKTCKVEDAPLAFRGILLGEIYHHQDNGVYYRDSAGSLSKQVDFAFRKAMYKQVMKDVKIAETNRLITPGQSSSIAALQKELLRIGFLRKVMETRQSKLLFLFTNILFSRKIGLPSKISFIKRTLLNIPTILGIYRLYKGSRTTG